MPIPTPTTTETKSDFLAHVIALLINEGRPRKESVAIALNKWRQHMNRMEDTAMKDKPELLAFCDGHGFAALEEGDERGPTELFLPYGLHRFTQGRETVTFEMTPADGEQQLAEFQERAKDVVIDYAHQTMKSMEAPAAGWIDKIDLKAERDGKPGIAYHVKNWTTRALEYLKNGEYRYFSPVFRLSRRHPIRVHSFALTNAPALHGAPALVASDTEELKQLEDRMDKILKALSLKALADDSDNEQQVLDTITALSDAVGEVKSEVVDFCKLHDVPTLEKMTEKVKSMVPESELAVLSERVLEVEAEKAVAGLMSPEVGKLAEASKVWALESYKKDKTAFLTLMEQAPRVIPKGDGGKGGGGASNEDDTKLPGDITPDEYTALCDEFGKESVDADMAERKRTEKGGDE